MHWIFLPLGLVFGFSVGLSLTMIAMIKAEGNGKITIHDYSFFMNKMRMLFQK